MPTFQFHHVDNGQWTTVAPGISVCDLGLAGHTDGAWSLQLVRLAGEGARVEDMHRHEEGFSLAYVLRGWLDVEFEQLGHTHLAAGAVIPAYNGPMHRERACGGDLELLLLVTQRRVSEGGEQHIVVQQAADAPYVNDDDRGSAVRDFGLEGATGGRLRACALHARTGVAPTAAWQHCAEAFALLYAVAGEVAFEAADGAHAALRAGDLLHVAPGSRYRLASRSDDAHFLEMHLPT